MQLRLETIASLHDAVALLRGWEAVIQSYGRRDVSMTAALSVTATAREAASAAIEAVLMLMVDIGEPLPL